jgi:hypothetical protein
MVTIRSRDFLYNAHSNMQLLQQALQENEGAAQHHQNQLARLEQARAQALSELVSLYLPNLTRESFARLPSLTGYRQFEVNDPVQQMERRRHELSARVAAIEKEERYQRRAQLLDPVAGEVTLKYDEAKKQLDFFNNSMAQYENHPEFIGLVHRAYDTEEYQVDWWDMQYYTDWKYGDLITEEFGCERFKDVRENYLRLRAAQAEYRKDFDAVKKEKDDIEGLVQERAQALTALETLEADTLNACRQQLGEHLEYIDRHELAAWAAADESRTGLIKRIHGIEKKKEYLDELARNYLLPEREQLITMMTKLNNKIEKFSRPKHAYTTIPAEDASRWLKDPRQKLLKRRTHYNNSYQSINSFDRYDAFDYARDMLWWDLMTDGRIDGDFIPEVYDWREQHPGDSRISESDIGDVSSGLIEQSSQPRESLIDVS